MYCNCNWQTTASVRPTDRPSTKNYADSLILFYFSSYSVWIFVAEAKVLCCWFSHETQIKWNQTKPKKTKPREEEEATVAVIGAAAAAAATAIEGETLGQQTDHHTDIPTNRYRHKLHLNPSRRNNIRKLPGSQTDKLTRRKLHMKTGWIKNVHPWFTWKRKPKCSFLPNTLISIRCRRFHPVDCICWFADTSPVNI